MNESELFWYVAITFRKEKSIKERLDQLQIENYVPVRQKVREQNGKRIEYEQLVLPGYVFIHTTSQVSASLTKDLKMEMRYLKEINSFKPVIVPDKQMNDFIFLTSFSEDRVRLVPVGLKQGDKVKVIKGDFAGIEGELIRIAGHKRVVVRLEGIVAIATAYIPSYFLEQIV